MARSWLLLLLLVLNSGLEYIEATQGVCDTIRIEGSRFQKKKEGLYARMNDTATCGLRQVYRMATPKRDNYIFYLKYLNHWIVGSKICENNGGLYVKNGALSPELISAGWKEYKGGKWKDNAGIRVTCNDCKGPYYGKYCSNPCGNCQADSCHTFWGWCMQGCAPGYTGEDCRERCPEGRYGADCWGMCRCNGGDPCDPMTGSCPTGCLQGWSSDDCSVHNCHRLYQKYMGREKNMTSLCEHVLTINAISLANCQVRACNFDNTGNVIAYNSDDVNSETGVCVVRSCRQGDLQLSTLHGGWNIYVSKDAMDYLASFPNETLGRPGSIAALPSQQLASRLVSRGNGNMNAPSTDVHFGIGTVILLSLVISVLVVVVGAVGFTFYKRFRDTCSFGGFSYYRHNQDQDDEVAVAGHDEERENKNDMQPF